ncbi:hypothetical protein CDD83_5933 [Cordyceps sp. RAO-2017]|nr:hypothetical protein CDD83_5933 [Cordyceps sp. RAO-2017]
MVLTLEASTPKADGGLRNQPDLNRRRMPNETRARMNRCHWYRTIQWTNVVFDVLVPLCGLISAFWVRLQWRTLVFSVVYYLASMLGITAGYHRLWSHTSYRAEWPVQLFLAFTGAAAIQGPIRTWARVHRVHHRYTDSDKDPHSINKGFFFAHMGWLILKGNDEGLENIDISDLDANPIVAWQFRNFATIAIFSAFLFPMLFAGLSWGDYCGGLIYAGALRGFVVQQLTFCVNSIAHYVGEQPFDDRLSPRNNTLLAAFTLGEGYHNFHHEFPADYRHSHEWRLFDTTAWIIRFWKYLEIASDLKQFRANEVEKSRLQQCQKTLEKRQSQIDWGRPLALLPIVEWDEYIEEAKNGRCIMVIAGIVHDVTTFVTKHPGGKRIISTGIGKDATAMFNGGVYCHSNAAHNMLVRMRVGVIRGGGEVENLKRQAQPREDALPADELALRAGRHMTKVVTPISRREGRITTMDSKIDNMK